MKRLVADKNVNRAAVVLLAIFCWSAPETLAQRTLDDLTPRKFDEYVLEGEQEWLRLDRFVAQLRREPKKLGYAIVYAERKIDGPGVYYDGEDWKRWVWHNLKARGLSEDRFVSINGGLRERGMIELWIVTPGTQMPKPSPTATETVVCPSVNVLGDYYVRRREQPLTFKTHLSAWNVYNFPSANFRWTVSSGKIVSGEGTDTITVDVSHSSDNRIHAAVEVLGLSRECKNTDSSTTVVGVVPYKFDEFGKIPSDDLKAHLDHLAIYLQRDAALRAYIITYNARFGTRSEAKTWAARMKNFLVNTRGIEPERIETLDGGYREELSSELWLSQLGAASPTPWPSVDPKYVRPHKGKSKG